jgi:hypothetical protein
LEIRLGSVQNPAALWRLLQMQAGEFKRLVEHQIG